MMSSWNCSIVPLYFPVSPVPPFPSLLPAFLRIFPKKSFLYPPCSCTYFPRDLYPTYISLFSYSTYQGAPVPKSLVNANWRIKILLQDCIYLPLYLRVPSTLLYCLCTPIYPRTVLHIPSTPLYGLGTLIYPRTLLHIPSTPLYGLGTLIYPRTLLHIPSTPLYSLGTPIYPRTLLHISSTPLYRSCSLISIPVAF